MLTLDDSGILYDTLVLKKVTECVALQCSSHYCVNCSVRQHQKSSTLYWC